MLGIFLITAVYISNYTYKEEKDIVASAKHLNEALTKRYITEVQKNSTLIPRQVGRPRVLTMD